jgi:hypothetical protein
MVNQESFLWHRQLRVRIGNRGLRALKKQLERYQIQVLFAGIWVVDGQVYLQPFVGLVEMMERDGSWTINC